METIASLVKVSAFGDEEVNSINARLLHERLEVKSQFTDWIKRRIEEAMLEEGIDFITTQKNVDNIIEKFQQKEFILTLDAAKHICMLERSEIGKSIRQEFIALEKAVRTNPASLLAGMPLDKLAAIADTARRLQTAKNQVKMEQDKLKRLMSGESDSPEHAKNEGKLTSQQQECLDEVKRIGKIPRKSENPIIYTRIKVCLKRGNEPFCRLLGSILRKGLYSA